MTFHPVNTVITCHRNADFDAVSALVGAARLYPDSILLFPGTQERQLQQLYDDVLRYLYDFRQLKEIDPDAVRRVVVLDTSQADRVPHVAPLLEREDVEVHVWDHHPGDPSLPHITFSRVEMVGSTSTLLAEELRSRGTALGCEDATILGLGIYGDTGSFGYLSTGPRDFHAASWLLEQGMDVGFISLMLRYELNRDQLRALNELLDSAEVHDMAGATLVFATTHFEEYLNDFAILASRFDSFLSYDVFFGLGAMEDKVQVVARSKLPQVDVGVICKLLGGGGHPTAASAAVRDKTIPEVKDFILNQLSLRAVSDKTAVKLMSAPVVGVEATATIREAEAVMVRYGLKAVPVFRNGTRICAGWLEHQLAVRAISHGLGDVSVAAYMQRNFQVVTRGDDLQALMDIIVGERQRMVPVVDGPDMPERHALGDSPEEEEEWMDLEESLKQRPVVGVVTRTDLIRTFTDDENTQLPKPRQSAKSGRSLKKTMHARLAPQAVSLLELAGKTGDRLGLNVYVVGGFVRDLLMTGKGRNWPDIDIDLVVEGDATAFANAMADELGGRVSEHREFMTALVLFSPSSLDGHVTSQGKSGRAKNGKAYPSENLFRMDVASARLEYYASPAALPTVELSSLKMDLYRRDFTINAMAIQLNTKNFGLLVDFFDGQIDIKQKRIRMLHSLSFVEDPTRALRAVRFEQRYGFRIGIQADRLIRNAIELGLIDRLSEKRICNELALMLHEKDPLACFIRMQEFGMLAAIHPQLDLPPWKQEMLEKTAKIIAWHRHLYLPEEPDLIFMFLLAVCRNASTPNLREVMDRLDIPPGRKQDLLHLRFRLMDALSQVENWRRDEGRLSELHEILHDVPLEGLLYLAVRVDDDTLHQVLTRYIYEGRKARPDINGNDLRGMGLTPGPVFKYILNRVLAAKLDGLAPTRESQFTLAASLAMQWEGERDRLRPKQRKKLCREDEDSVGKGRGGA